MFWSLTIDAAAAAVRSTPGGLTAAEAEDRLAALAQDRLSIGRPAATLRLLASQFESPLILLLVAATVLSGALGDTLDATIILAIILASGILGFWQERSATRAVDALRRSVRAQAEVIRDDRPVDVPIEAVVPGDLVRLNAGDLIPGDGLLIDARSLLVDESALTGESFPAEKSIGASPPDAPPAERRNAVFLGTHVVSGSGAALILGTGSSTVFGRLTASVGAARVTTSFEQGLTAFGGLLLRLTGSLVVVMLAVNIALGRPLVDAALFSLALAVGLTPQLLPAIVTISLSQGARLMARRQVIVKRLDAIEDIGAMTILCTDKTGTMTEGSVRFEAALTVDGKPSAAVREAARLNATLQRGFSNPIDLAIAAAPGEDAQGGPGPRLLDELPYDFARRRLSVLVTRGDRIELITKGAVERVLPCCDRAFVSSETIVPIDEALATIQARFEALSGAGLRVLGIAARDLPMTVPSAASEPLTTADEHGMAFLGFLTFVDPPRDGVAATIAELRRVGVGVRMITGDNRFAALEVGRRVGLGGGELLTGAQIATADDATLADAAARTAIFAEVDPDQKERIVRLLRGRGQVVGYLGDGINDAPALHAADVGISVNSAVDIAKESASIVLLDKDLAVLLDGILQGRRTFANTMKYVFTTISANFGNMLSLAIVAAVLPFLPLLATQILLVNFLTDIPATTIATDRVDPEQLDRPLSWQLGRLRSFMLRFGSLSSIFDLVTFAVLWFGFAASPELFRSGWFLESVATEIAVLLVLRTARPFIESRPSALLAGASLAIAVITLAVLYSPLGSLIGLVPLPPAMLVALGLVTVSYVAATELVKERFYRGSRATPIAGGSSGLQHWASER